MGYDGNYQLATSISTFTTRREKAPHCKRTTTATHPPTPMHHRPAVRRTDVPRILHRAPLLRPQLLRARSNLYHRIVHRMRRRLPTRNSTTVCNQHDLHVCWYQPPHHLMVRPIGPIQPTRTLPLDSHELGLDARSAIHTHRDVLQACAATAALIAICTFSVCEPLARSAANSAWHRRNARGNSVLPTRSSHRQRCGRECPSPRLLHVFRRQGSRDRHDPGGARAGHDAAPSILTLQTSTAANTARPAQISPSSLAHF